VKRQTVIKAGRHTFVALAVFLAVGWLAFVPSAKEPPYQFVSAWGEKGSGTGQFSAPGGVAVNRNGELYVADFYGQRVQKLKADGTFIREWGTPGRTGHAIGQFHYPTDTALDQTENIYMADGYGNRIQVFGPDGTFLRKWGGPFARGIYGPFNGWFTAVTSIAVDSQGNLFAADFYNNRIQKFAADGTFLTTFGAKGSGPAQFNHVSAVAVADDGTVFALDFGNNRVETWRAPKP